MYIPLELVDSIVEIIGLKKDASELTVIDKARTRKILFFAIVVGMAAFFLDITKVISELLVTNIETLGVAFSAIPIIGAISLSIVSWISLHKIHGVYNNSDLTKKQKFQAIAQETLKLTIQLTIVVLMIGMLSFPPTAIPLTTVILSLSISHLCLSLVTRIVDKRKQEIRHQRHLFTSNHTFVPQPNRNSIPTNPSIHRNNDHAYSQDTVAKLPHNELDSQACRNGL